jgi:hypothetical protein
VLERIHLALDRRMVNSCDNGPSGSIKNETTDEQPFASQDGVC